MRFIDGLRDELKAAVLIQRPSDLDTAYVLASLQEEVTTPSRKRNSRRHDFIYPHKQDVPAPLPLPAPPRLTRPPDDKRAPEAGRGSDADRSRSAGKRWSSLIKHTVELRACVNIALKNGPAIIVVLTRYS